MGNLRFASDTNGLLISGRSEASRGQRVRRRTSIARRSFIAP
jgi:hypothetical protein